VAFRWRTIPLSSGIWWWEIDPPIET